MNNTINPIVNLPKDILSIIFAYIGLKNGKYIKLTCKAFCNIINIHNSVYFNNLSNEGEKDKYLLHFFCNMSYSDITNYLKNKINETKAFYPKLFEICCKNNKLAANGDNKYLYVIDFINDNYPNFLNNRCTLRHTYMMCCRHILDNKDNKLVNYLWKIKLNLLHLESNNIDCDYTYRENGYIYHCGEGILCYDAERYAILDDILIDSIINIIDQIDIYSISEGESPLLDDLFNKLNLFNYIDTYSYHNLNRILEISAERSYKIPIQKYLEYYKNKTVEVKYHFDIIISLFKIFLENEDADMANFLFSSAHFKNTINYAIISYSPLDKNSQNTLYEYSVLIGKFVELNKNDSEKIFYKY